MRVWKKVINAAKYYGIGVLIKRYFDLLWKAMRIEELEAIVSEAFTVREQDMEFELAMWINKAKERLKKVYEQSLTQLFLEAYKRGTRKVMNPRGKRIEVKIPVGTTSILFNFIRQKDYINKLFNDITEKLREKESFTQEDLKDLKKFVRWRVKLIAQNEIVLAHNEGLKKAMAEAGVKKYYWITQNDMQVCNVCKKMERESKRIGGFMVGDPKSPMPVRDSHPNCRCFIVAVE